MCELFAISSKFPTRVTFSLEEFSRRGGETGPHKDGWGIAFYDGCDAQVFREAEPAAYSQWMRFLHSHSHQSRRVISHIRRATQGDIALRNTQPFTREGGGRRHVFCHNGDLHNFQGALTLKDFTPIGETDSEYAFCYLMGELESLWSEGKPTLEQRVELIRQTFKRLSDLGQANFLYSDGEYLYAFANRRKHPDDSAYGPGLYYLNRECNAGELSGVTLEDNNDVKQAVVLFASVPLSSEKWLPFETNQLIVVKDGKIVQIA